MNLTSSNQGGQRQSASWFEEGFLQHSFPTQDDAQGVSIYLPRPPPKSQRRKCSEANVGAIHLCVAYQHAGTANKAISTIMTLWPVKALLERKAAKAEVGTLISQNYYVLISLT